MPRIEMYTVWWHMCIPHKHNHHPNTIKHPHHFRELPRALFLRGQPLHHQPRQPRPPLIRLLLSKLRFSSSRISYEWNQMVDEMVFCAFAQRGFGCFVCLFVWDLSTLNVSVAWEFSLLRSGILHKYRNVFFISSSTKGHLGCFLRAFSWSCLSNQIVSLRVGLCLPYSVPTRSTLSRALLDWILKCVASLNYICG